MFQNPNVLLDFSNYGPVDDWTQVTVMALFLLFVGSVLSWRWCVTDSIVYHYNVLRVLPGGTNPAADCQTRD